MMYYSASYLTDINKDFPGLLVQPVQQQSINTKSVPDLEKLEEEVNTDAYLESVSPDNLPSRPFTPSTMVAEIDGIIEIDESSENENEGDAVHTLNITTFWW